MKATVENGRLCVDVCDLINSLDDDECIAIIDDLACLDQIIEAVASQIVEGWTEHASHGSITFGPMPHTALDKAKRYLAKSASDVAKQQIERLEKIAVDAEKRHSDEQTLRINAEQRIWDLQSALRQYRGDAA